MSKYISVREAADHVGVSTQTVRRWIQAGRLPAIAISARLFRIEREDLDRFLDSMK